jgi:hypothetical protein
MDVRPFHHPKSILSVGLLRDYDPVARCYLRYLVFEFVRKMQEMDLWVRWRGFQVPYVLLIVRRVLTCGEDAK